MARQPGLAGAQRSVDLLSPHDFARRPLTWLSLISRRRASITYSPSFGYELAVRRAKARPTDNLDLSSLRFVDQGAAPSPPEVKKAMKQWWGGVILSHIHI